MTVDSSAVRMNFSRRAEAYVSAARCQRHAAETLADLIRAHGPNPDSPCVFSDLGSGTGFLTSALFARYPHCSVYALDIAPGMNRVLCAQPELRPYLESGRLHVEEADFVRALPNLMPGHIVSALAVQWVPDFPQFLRDVRARLRPGDCFAFSTLTDRTFFELRETFAQLGLVLPGPHLYSRSALESCVREVFRVEAIRFDVWTETFDSVLAFFHQLHDTGAINATGNRLSAGALRAVIRHYRSHFAGPAGSVAVSYALAYCVCQIPDAVSGECS